MGTHHGRLSRSTARIRALAARGFRSVSAADGRRAPRNRARSVAWAPQAHGRRGARASAGLAEGDAFLHDPVLARVVGEDGTATTRNESTERVVEG